MPSSTTLTFSPPFPDAMGLSHVHQVMGDAGFMLQKQEDLSDHRLHVHPHKKYTYHTMLPPPNGDHQRKMNVLKEIYQIKIDLKFINKED